ncbi:MAG: hypothetical protein R2711_00835 [Acidimicrobiales bacterium]
MTMVVMARSRTPMQVKLLAAAWPLARARRSTCQVCSEAVPRNDSTR